ncbi:potassium-transporting ATPase subunit KdpC [Herbiconiux sp. CPCC 205763]|uniref:Potassium-transporting ATPase KdpC subunit n=1 Tax=Herbiconiux aconitum TaxID=2970913 RepID=A0ABT2GL99_9MICO|nr:potassium-transporting ATPase subunit KdpC [Herbiconiux aconitum]MCS5716996.1 potassium-transporting ATPase subunit KdpC [Herbiconiux aconitum]
MASTRGFARPYWVALRYMIVATIALGIVYPLAVLGVGQLVLPAQSNGSLVTNADGSVLGSTLIGQSFTDADGNALPEWFQSRPSAAGYDAAGSVGSNFGPENPDFLDAIAERKAAIAELEGVDPADIPVDALTASGSGLDPHISPQYALLQVPRVAEARGLEESQVHDLVEASIQGRDLGYLGNETVNVLQLNIALAQLAG